MTQNIATKEETTTSFNKMLPRDVYQNITIDQSPRLLSLIDRNPYSKTYGSFLRDYWQYKTLTDFSSATCQQCVLALSCVYLLNSPLNNYFNNQKILDRKICRGRSFPGKDRPQYS